MNQCNFIGRLGKDPEMKFLPSGGAVANMSIAISEKYKDKNTGQMVEKTEWVRCSAFNRTAEVIGEYLKKGSKVMVTGKFTTRKWQDQSGQDKFSTEIVVQNMEMLDSRSDNQGDQGAAQSQGQQASQQSSGHTPQVTKVDNSFDNFDDDIPF